MLCRVYCDTTDTLAIVLVNLLKGLSLCCVVPSQFCFKGLSLCCDDTTASLGIVLVSFA